MHLIHCYSTRALGASERQRLLDSAQRALSEAFGEDTSLLFEELAPCDVPAAARGALYLLVATLEGALPPQARAALSQKLYEALGGEQYVYFYAFPPEAAAPCGQLLPAEPPREKEAKA